LIFGGIQYGSSETEFPVWNYLEGTKNEGDTVLKILERNAFQVRYITDEKATETYFKKNAGAYDIIHIATHGFFFEDPNKLRFEENRSEYGDLSFRGFSGTLGTRSFVNNENPLMRSGLVFAGANEVWSGTELTGSDDGVLTAQEVTQVDLRNNKLVVLSACETGLGDIRGNEGVYGLQRSLRMAGVNDIIMSLWEIPDYETILFMGKFYRYLTSGENMRQAFNHAQHEMRLKYDPFYWGGFVLLE
jgi:CHAT domain-containing protein